VGRRVIVVFLAAAAVALGLLGTYSYGENYWQHRGFAPVARLPRAQMGRLLTVHFYSAALHRRSDYLVYLPPRYSTKYRYPVYYLLHGAPGNPQDFISVVNLDVRLSNRLSEHELRPMILVMPDGRPGGSTFFDSEWANTRAGAFESYVLDVVRDVDRRFATIPSRPGRVIAGYSSGGYGALNIALHHLGVFANVQSWSGYFVQRRKCCLAFADASAASLAYNSPLDYARTLTRAELARYPLRVYMFTGRDDPDGRWIGQMAAELRRVGSAASYNLFPGGHDWRVWYARVDAMMLQASRMVTHPPPAPRTSAPRRVRAHRTRTPSPVRAHRTPMPSPRPAVTPIRVRARPVLELPPSRPAARTGRGLGPSAWIGLALAVVSAALINLGFLLQQRALVHRGGEGLRAVLAAARSRTWLGGQAVGWVGFAVQVLAVALAPLSLVQAFAAGGLALSVPLAAGIFAQRVPRIQVIGVVAMAAGLVVLPLGVPRPGGGMAAAAMIGVTAVWLVAGVLTAGGGGAMARAAAAGLFYGVADAAIKAIALGVHAHGAAGLFSGWTLLVLAATFAGFAAFQAALRRGNAVSAISLMTALTTLTALLFGLTAFHESLGSGLGVRLVHLLAIALVLGCVPVLAGADVQAPAGWRAPLASGRDALLRPARRAGTSAIAGLAAILAVLTGTGLLYGLRGLGWLNVGPRLGDALPLLQLAGFDAQPLARVAAAWLLAGGVLGLMLSRVKPVSRLSIAAGLGLLLLLFTSEACFALAHNVRLSDTLAGRVPGAGAWAEALLLAAGVALPVVRLRARPRLERGLDPRERGLDRGEPLADRRVVELLDAPLHPIERVFDTFEPLGHGPQPPG
jgi:enterochelin esterase-like enzyme